MARRQDAHLVYDRTVSQHGETARYSVKARDGEHIGFVIQRIGAVLGRRGGWEAVGTDARMDTRWEAALALISPPDPPDPVQIEIRRLRAQRDKLAHTLAAHVRDGRTMGDAASAVMTALEGCDWTATRHIRERVGFDPKDALLALRDSGLAEVMPMPWPQQGGTFALWRLQDPIRSVDP